MHCNHHETFYLQNARDFDIRHPLLAPVRRVGPSRLARRPTTSVAHSLLPALLRTKLLGNVVFLDGGSSQ